MIRPLLASLVLALPPVAAQSAPVAAIHTILPPAIPANGDPAMTDTLTGRWTVTEVAGAAVPAGGPVRLEFGEGSVSGKGGCNSFSARLTLNGQALTFGPARATKMACDSEAMALEAAFMRALGQIDRYEMAGDGRLDLYGGAAVLMRAARE
jgi:heat shock protein HslJ